jgi:hypothetical protein
MRAESAAAGLRLAHVRTVGDCGSDRSSGGDVQEARSWLACVFLASVFPKRVLARVFERKRIHDLCIA